MRKDPIKLTTGLGFAGVLALMGLISFISLSQMSMITEQMSQLINETNTKISAANAMRDSIRLRGESLYNMSLTDDYIERDEYRSKFYKYALQYKVARDTLYSYRMSSREAKLLDQLMTQTRAAKKLNDIAAENLLSDLPEKTVKDSIRLANNARHGILKKLDELVQLQEDISKSVVDDAKQYQETISTIISFLSLAAFFIAIYIAQLVIRETTRKNYEIRFQATHDELTKLVNRKEFNHRLQDALKTAVDNHEVHALCFMDLDKFKIINDTCGHKAGDQLLIQLTRIIKEKIRSHDTLARLGGDEFGLLLEGCTLEKATEIAEGIVSLVKNHEFKWQDKTFHVGVSIGLIMMTHETRSIDKALSQADIACYAAKDMGRNQVHIHGFGDKYAKKIHKELGWVAQINNSNCEQRFALHLQAVTNLQEQQSTMIYEVLLRLKDDTGNWVSPESYIPAAERFNLMQDVDYWVIKNSFKYLSELYKKFPECNIQLSINISANSLGRYHFTEFVIEQLQKYNITPGVICFEIAEANAVKNISQSADIITRLRKHNIKFALDNFGSSMTSISYLKDLQVDYLKIDGNIIKNISQNTTDKAMVAAINQAGKVMNIEIVAKHVENIFTYNQLKEMGIDYVQGFYIEKPFPLSQQMETLKKHLPPLSKRH